jgi:hypothetical protein
MQILVKLIHAAIAHASCHATPPAAPAATPDIWHIRIASRAQTQLHAILNLLPALFLILMTRLVDQYTQRRSRCAN